jgi:hypothetical protein
MRERVGDLGGDFLLLFLNKFRGSGVVRRFFCCLYDSSADALVLRLVGLFLFPSFCISKSPSVFVCSAISRARLRAISFICSACLSISDCCKSFWAITLFNFSSSDCFSSMSLLFVDVKSLFASTCLEYCVQIDSMLSPSSDNFEVADTFDVRKHSSDLCFHTLTGTRSFTGGGVVADCFMGTPK